MWIILQMLRVQVLHIYYLLFSCMFFLILELLSCILSEDNNLILGVSILVTIKIKYIRDRHELYHRLEHSDRENRTTFVDVALLLEFFRRNDLKSHILFTFQPDYPETFCKW